MTNSKLFADKAKEDFEWCYNRLPENSSFAFFKLIYLKMPRIVRETRQTAAV